ncbi:MAG: NADH-quinone oxidoreductase subunit L [Abditibacteriota bacterium]|nr:NADH-quinone oxidoreductase subunit L [Abditibacteriota bacterium]
MNLLFCCLAVLPLLGLLLTQCFREGRLRNTIVITVSVLMLAAGCLLCIDMLRHQTGPAMAFSPEAARGFSAAVTVLDIALLLYVMWRGVEKRRFTSPLLAGAQLVCLAFLELFISPETEQPFFVDQLSLILLLLAVIIGPLILIFACGYMHVHEGHTEHPGRQHIFFGIIFAFLFAMVMLATADNICWMYTFWEVTTLCSFLLIQFDKTEESVRNAFRTLDLNMLGGLCFIAGIILLALFAHTTSLHDICKIKLAGPVSGNAIAFAVVLLCIAGFTKSAMFPFQSWLLGAMVAPTPVSALLHSSTMVKAGVYLVIRLCPVISGTVLGSIVAAAGGFTFMAASVLAVSESNAKRVLAYSTIANLGLIICCAGIGTKAALGAAILLMIFHAVSKGMLFLAVGTIEQTIGSRNIEDMQGLLKKMPFTTMVTAVGIISMLLPPFGVLLTKWIAIEAAVWSPLVLIFIILGSAFTIVFWAKWIGIISTMSYKPRYVRETTHRCMQTVLSALLALVLFCSCFIGIIYRLLIYSFVEAAMLFNGYSETLRLEASSQSALQLFSMSGDLVGGFAVMAVFLLIFILMLFIPWMVSRTKSEIIRPPYFGGELYGNDIRGIDFVGPGDKIEHVIVRNYYFRGAFGNGTLALLFLSVSIGIILVLVGVTL